VSEKQRVNTNKFYSCHIFVKTKYYNKLYNKSTLSYAK
jgi:hypothetical protein